MFHKVTMSNMMVLKVVILLVTFMFLCVAYPINENGSGLLENDILTIRNNTTQNSTNSFNAFMITSDRWPYGQVPYKFDQIFDNDMKMKVLNAIGEIELNTCVRFINRKNESNYVLFMQDPSTSCYSNVGMMDRGRQEVSLPHWCLDIRENILHELMHVLGFVHEQNRHDRDAYITINWPNVRAIGGHIDDNDWKKRGDHETNDFNIEYDYASVMHYPSMLRGRRVISTKKSGTIISHGLSAKDFKRINKAYSCFHSDNDNSNNLPACTDGLYYCGSELKSLNYRNVQSTDNLYQCRNNKAIFHHNCSSGCTDDYSARCSCKPNKLYCGYELYVMNWGSKYDNQHIYKCKSDKSVSVKHRCHKRCTKHNHYCSNVVLKCKFGLSYCGYQLSSLSYSGKEPQTLYKCMSGKKISEGELCNNGCSIGNNNSYCNIVNLIAYQNYELNFSNTRFVSSYLHLLFCFVLFLFCK